MLRAHRLLFPDKNVFLSKFGLFLKTVKTPMKYFIIHLVLHCLPSPYLVAESPVGKALKVAVWLCELNQAC